MSRKCAIMASIQEQRTYKIINVRSDTVLDLSGTDGHSISGWNDNGGDNQKWTLGRLDNQWTFRNRGNGRYLGLNSNELQDGTRLQGVDQEFGWNVFHDERDNSAFRIFVPGSTLNIDLNQGKIDNGTTVHIWSQWETQQQTWRFEEV